jgi:hypothetical protein
VILESRLHPDSSRGCHGSEIETGNETMKPEYSDES